LLVLLVSAFALSGCLEGESSEEAVAPPSPTNTAPTISGSPSTAINIGDIYSFIPVAADADGDGLTFSIENPPVWATFDNTSGELSGQPTLANVGVYTNILIRVSDGTDSAALPAFAISVDQIGTLSTTLTWTAPTQNEDGTELVDLAGYRIYWGTTPGVYTNSATIDTIGTTTYMVQNLSPGTYEFVATAYNTAGVESRYSSPATKVLQ
jgi:hypothetical protein